MRYWDTLAIVPLLIDEPNSAWSMTLARENQPMVVWCLTRTEALSALKRRQRSAALPHDRMRVSDVPPRNRTS